MNNIVQTRKSREFQPFRTERRAEAHDLRHALLLTIVAATAFAVAALFGAGLAAAMQLNAAAEKAPRVLAYAEPMPERFGAFDALRSHDGEHELNDAWMGMTVVSADGVVLGYVVDAFIDADGSLDEIVIEPAGTEGAPETPVYVPAQFAELGAQTVQVHLDARTVAQLEPATDLAMLGE
jgi:hypothetical protein